MRSLCLLILLSLACQKHETRGKQTTDHFGTPDDERKFANPGLTDGPPSSKELIFSAVNDRFDSSTIYRLDLESFQLSTILKGESGDPALFISANEVLFFNRTATSQNFYRLKHDGDHWKASKQQRFAGGMRGDPHDALYLGNDRVLLAHYVQGNLVLMRQSTGELIRKIDVVWDVPRGTVFKPEALVAADGPNGEYFIYVIHQGTNAQDGILLANGSQHVFVLQDHGSADLAPVDIDPDQPGIQGIRLKGSMPVPVRYHRNDRVLLVSLCARMSGEACVNAVESIDPATHAVTEHWNFSADRYSGNGPITGGPNHNTFYANVEEQTAPGTFAQKVIEVDLEHKTTKSVYDFAPESGGFWGTFFDEGRKTLYVGDKGRLTVIPMQGPARVVPILNKAPYSGVLSAKLDR